MILAGYYTPVLGGYTWFNLCVRPSARESSFCLDDDSNSKFWLLVYASLDEYFDVLNYQHHISLNMCITVDHVICA